MKAARCRSFSADDPLAGLELGDAAPPPERAGWTTVAVRAAALNAHDLWSLRGVGLTSADLPRVLGSDGTGVSADGRDVIVYPIVAEHPIEEADALDPSVSPLLSERHDGTLAEFVSVPVHNLLPKPAHLTFEQAAALPTAWLTAYRMLFTKGRVKPGDTVLVQGATGGVATALIALGAAGGLRVWVTARTADGRDWAHRQGAAATFEVGARLPERVDAVMETVGAATWAHSLRCTRVGGTIVVAGATSGAMPTEELQRIFFHQLTVVGVRVGTLTEMRALLALIERHAIVPPVDSVHALDQARAAMKRMAAGGLTGKVIVTPG